MSVSSIQLETRLVRPGNVFPVINSTMSVFTGQARRKALCRAVNKGTRYFRNLGNKASETTKCFACRVAISVIQNRINTGASEDEIGEFAYSICTTFKIETPRVCTGVTNLFKRELTQVLANVVLEPNQICSFVFQGCGKVENPFHDWTIPLTPFPKPPIKPPHLPKFIASRGCIRVWWHCDERTLAVCIRHNYTGRLPGVIVWGAIGYTSRSPLVRIEGFLNSARHISGVLRPVALTFIRALRNPTFQQDNAQPHVAGIVRTFLDMENVRLLPWPARSPDLSPIENV
ncbi:transposable element Tcb1 transposase [Trichonephila clavipes]|nr:transposable element Tcb1 transposase [Trichonephila clavipes]